MVKVLLRYWERRTMDITGGFHTGTHPTNTGLKFDERREPWSFAADELLLPIFLLGVTEPAQLPCCCCEYHLTLEDRYIVFMFAADLPSSSSS
jgi:hypothetical protein